MGKIDQMGENSGRYLDDNSNVVNIIEATYSAVRTYGKTAQILKGSATNVFTGSLTAAATHTSGETSVAGFGSVLVETTISSAGVTAKTDIYGSLSAGGTKFAIFDKDTSAQMTTGLLTSSRTQRFTGLPDYLAFTTALTADMTAGGSVSIKILPLNL